MHLGASRIALSNPRLHHFTISFLPPNVPITRGVPPPTPLEKGRYELVCDEHGIPTSLLAWERKERGVGSWASWRHTSTTPPGTNGAPNPVVGHIPGVGIGPNAAGMAPAGHNQINIPLAFGLYELNVLVSSVFRFFSTMFSSLFTMGFLGVFLFPFMTTEFCNVLIEELEKVERFYHNELTAANTMHRYVHTYRIC